VTTGSYSDDRARPLTPRMRQVLAGADAGETAAATARRLGVAAETVKIVRAAARARVGEPTTAQAAARARQAGLL